MFRGEAHMSVLRKVARDFLPGPSPELPTLRSRCVRWLRIAHEADRERRLALADRCCLTRLDDDEAAGLVQAS